MGSYTLPSSPRRPPSHHHCCRPIKQPPKLLTWYSKAPRRGSKQHLVGHPVVWTRVSQRAVVLLP